MNVKKASVVEAPSFINPIEKGEIKIEKIKPVAVKWLLSLILPLMIFLIPINNIFTLNLKIFLTSTLFVILIIAFELLPLLVSALLLPTLYLITGIAPIPIVFSSWTSQTVWIVLSGLILSNVLDECGLLKRISYSVINKCGGTYIGTVFGCFFIGVILNIVTFCNGWLVASALVYGVCKAIDLKPSKEASLICFAGTLGGTGATIFLYYPAYYSMIEVAIQKFIPSYHIGILTSLVYNGIVILFYVLAIFVFIKVYNIKNMDLDFEKDLFKKKLKELGKLSGREKRAIVAIISLLIYLFSTHFTHLPVLYGFMMITFISFLPKIELCDSSILSRIKFETVFFVATCLSIGLVGMHVGFSKFMLEVISPVLVGKSPLFICVIFLLLGTIANLFMTPMAMLGGLSVPLVEIGMHVGISPIGTAMILLYSCEVLFFPYQSAGNLMMYSYGMMPMKEFIKQEGLKSILMIIGFVIIVYPLWQLFNLI